MWVYTLSSARTRAIARQAESFDADDDALLMLPSDEYRAFT